jgi:flagellar basal body-associated protein FliL
VFPVQLPIIIIIIIIQLIFYLLIAGLTAKACTINPEQRKHKNSTNTQKPNTKQTKPKQ